MFWFVIFFFKQKTAYEMRISYWSSDVCSSDLKRSFVPVTVRENLTWDEVSRVEVTGPELPGVSIEMGQIRDYPFADTMAHVLGYVASVAERDPTAAPLLERPAFRIGQNGITQNYAHPLSGTTGTPKIKHKASGR